MGDKASVRTGALLLSVNADVLQSLVNPAAARRQTVAHTVRKWALTWSGLGYIGVVYVTGHISSYAVRKRKDCSVVL